MLPPVGAMFCDSETSTDEFIRLLSTKSSLPSGKVILSIDLVKSGKVEWSVRLGRNFAT